MSFLPNVTLSNNDYRIHLKSVTDLLHLGNEEKVAGLIIFSQLEFKGSLSSMTTDERKATFKNIIGIVGPDLLQKMTSRNSTDESGLVQSTAFHLVSIFSEFPSISILFEPYIDFLICTVISQRVIIFKKFNHFV
jgi:hypothetical protein